MREGYLAHLSALACESEKRINTFKQEWRDSMQIVGAPAEREKRQILALATAATALISFGLGITSKMDLSDLTTAVGNLNNNQQLVFASLKDLAKTQVNFRLQLNRFHYNIIDSEVEKQTREALRVLENAGRRWMNGLYSLARGELTAEIVSVKELSHGLELVQRDAARVGMRVAPMDNLMESLFSLPVSTMAEGDTVHVWISVPLVPLEAPVMDVIHLEHVPVPFGEYLVALDSTAPYLAIDASRRFHRELSASDLASCERHKHMFFCAFDSFSTSVDSCAVALLRGNKEQATQLCERFVQKAPVVVSKKLGRSTSQEIKVFSGPTVSVERICPRGKALPTSLVSGNTTLHVPYGCYLRAAERATFVPHKPREATIACHGDEWTADDLLDGMTVGDMVTTLAQMNFTGGRLPLTRVKQVHVQRRTAWYAWAFIGAAVLTAIVVIDLFLRYGWLIRSYKKKLSQAA